MQTTLAWASKQGYKVEASHQPPLHDLSGRSCAEPRAPRYIRTLCEDAALYAPSRAWATVEGGPRHSPHAAALGLPRVTVLGVEASVDIVFGAQGVSP